MLNILENLPIFEWYFNYKNFILGIMSLVLSMILVASIFWQLDEQLDDEDICFMVNYLVGEVTLNILNENYEGTITLTIKNKKINRSISKNIIILKDEIIDIIPSKPGTVLTLDAKRESYNGGICGKALDGAHIENCYVYNIDLITTKGLFAGIAANSFFIHNYYDNAKITFIGKNDSGNQLSKNAQYTGTFINKENIPIYQLLNQWINETAPTLYPGYLFTRWTDGGENLPAVFISETQKSK